VTRRVSVGGRTLACPYIPVNEPWASVVS
jgi:hypothetical protein